MRYQTDLFGNKEQDLDKEWEKAGKLICRYPDCNGKCILKLTPEHEDKYGKIICSVCNKYQKWEPKPKNKKKSTNISTEELGWI